VAWLVLGLAIYFLYGMRKSVATSVKKTCTLSGPAPAGTEFLVSDTAPAGPGQQQGP
jgi:hypothetical protein